MRMEEKRSLLDFFVLENLKKKLYDKRMNL